MELKEGGEGPGVLAARRPVSSGAGSADRRRTRARHGRRPGSAPTHSGSMRKSGPPSRRSSPRSGTNWRVPGPRPTVPARPRRRSSSGPRSGSRGSSGCGMRSSSAPGRMPRPRWTGSGPTRSGSATRCGRHSRPGSPRSRRPAVTSVPGRNGRRPSSTRSVLGGRPPSRRSYPPAALPPRRFARPDIGGATGEAHGCGRWSFPAATADVTPVTEDLSWRTRNRRGPRLQGNDGPTVIADTG